MRTGSNCGRWRYDVKAKTGPDACQSNALSWDFLARHEKWFRGNARMRNMYANRDRMSDNARRAYRESAAAFLDTLEPAAPRRARVRR